MYREPRTAQVRGELVHRHLMRLMTNVLDLLYPPRCESCGRVGAVWCARCEVQLGAVALELVSSSAPPLLSIYATGTHEAVLQHAVHALKYANAVTLVEPLGNRLTGALDALGWRIDVIVPVPLYPTRERQRGFNQAALLGEYVARVRGIPYEHRAIERMRDTPPQVGKSRTERQDNVRDAFKAAASLHGTALLIDDVFTTGATMRACAVAARQAGAAAVYGLAVSAAPVPKASLPYP